MSRNESACKSDFCKDIRNSRGFARRIEDQFAVGIPDMLVVPAGGPVFLIEAKIIRASTWGATPKQEHELRRFRDAAGHFGWACELGFEVDKKIMRIRQVQRPDTGWNVSFRAWSDMGAAHFLLSAHEHWSKNFVR